MDKRYPKTLSQGANNTVIALSSTEVAKLFTEDTRSDIGSEAEKMKYANQINELVVKFVRLDLDEAKKWEMLVMERLYPLDFRTYEYEARVLQVDVFEEELKQLHEAGFVHHDLRRPSSEAGEVFDNIFLTNQGIRLIDVGISAIRDTVGEKLFSLYVAQEKDELAAFKSYYLSR
jgi:tRNA A-37 threonylcarbamoyl transferase component Bud32